MPITFSRISFEIFRQFPEKEDLNAKPWQLEKLKEIGLDENYNIEIVNSTDSVKREKYAKFLYQKMQRSEGLLERDCDRLVRKDRVIWGTCMVSCGDADAMVTGNTRRYTSTLDKVQRVVDPRKDEIIFGLNIMVNRGRTVFIADVAVHEIPTAEQLAEIAISSARVVKLFGYEPRVAFLSHSTFGTPKTKATKNYFWASWLFRTTGN